MKILPPKSRWNLFSVPLPTYSSLAQHSAVCYILILLRYLGDRNNHNAVERVVRLLHCFIKLFDEGA